MDEELDAGDIVLQRSTTVGPTDTVTDLFHRTIDMIGPITLDALDLIASGRTDWTPQDRSQATFFTSVHRRTATSTGPGPPRSSSVSSGHSPIRTPTLSPSSRASASAS
ncbi:hypothetical protein EN35_23630 [Rhodococcus qingshengii]|nr:hypothetical protein EN35_23630 [Rhodococcus qingshengii]